jgi:hypothetical protein
MSEQRVKELMTTDFIVIHLAESMQEVYPRISDLPERFVVVLDDEGVPLHLVTAGQMRRKMPRSLDWPTVEEMAPRLPEALLVQEGVSIGQAMVFFGAISKLEPQPEGLVVMRGAEVVGVLAYESLDDYYREKIVPEIVAEGKVVRAGQPVTVASAVFRCRRHPRCSFQVTLELVDEPPLCGIMAAHGLTQQMQ